MKKTGMILAGLMIMSAFTVSFFLRDTVAQESQATIRAGMVDLDRVVKEHPVMVEWTQELEKQRISREQSVEKQIEEQFGVTDQSQLSEEQRSLVQRFILQESQKFTAEMEPKHNEKLKIVENDVKEMGAVVATEKGLGLVLDRMIVIYGGVDVTDAIVEKINRSIHKPY